MKFIWSRRRAISEVGYRFSDGHAFGKSKLYTDDQSSGEPILQETTPDDIAAASPTDNFYILQEDGSAILRE